MIDNIFMTPIEGIPMIEPEYEPIPGEILLGYRIVYGQDTPLFVKPRPKRMNTLGWVSVVIGLIFFWPVSCVPCCLSYSYSESQQPVYGFPRYLSEKPEEEKPEEKPDEKTSNEK
jgi:hypothetical protein